MLAEGTYELQAYLILQALVILPIVIGGICWWRKSGGK